VIILTGIYTVLGGLRAVAYTEALQTIILIFGSILVTIFGLKALGGWDVLRDTLGSEAFNLWKPMIPEGIQGTWAPVRETGKMAWYFNDNYPWLGMLFCAPIVGLWYWTTDQYIVQRTLGAPNEKEARRGSIAAGFLKLLPVFIFIIPGMISMALAKTGISTEIQSQLLDANGEIIRDNAQSAFPLLVAYILPVGVRGIVVAGLLAALMSSLAGIFNASATLFTIDFYARLKPDASQQTLVRIGRIATFVMVIIGLIWIPVIKGGKGLYDYLQGVQSYLAPPIAVVFFMGVFWKRMNAKGCMATLITGFAMGLFRLAVDTPVKLFNAYEYTQGSFFWVVNNIFFQYYSMLITLVCIAVAIIVSKATKEPAYEKISGLTYGTTTDDHRRESRSSWTTTDVISSVLLVVLIVLIYLSFTG
jgi:SSS family solute:Na+ symporter